MHSPETIQILRNTALYEASSIPEAILKYETALLSLEDDVKSTLHDRRLRRYHDELIDLRYLSRLRSNFNEIYNLISTSYPDIRFVIDGRRKSFISTDNKILKLIQDNQSLDLLRDTSGFRIMLLGNNSPELISQCYLIMNDIITHFTTKGLTLCEADPVSQTEAFNPEKHSSVLVPTNEFEIISEEFVCGIKDYVRFPKENGYQSIHVIFRGTTGECFEIQVRTFDMHVYAESGYAKHSQHKLQRYGKTFSFDRNKIHIPGYGVADDGTVYDFIGLEEGLNILKRQKTF